MHILITGSPRSGKTTLIESIIPFLKGPCGFFTEEILENDSRAGFKIQALHGDVFVLAHKNLESEVKVADYGVDVTSLDKTMDEVERDMEGKDFVVVDEIGKMEWSSAKFRDFIAGVLDSDKRMIATISESEYDSGHDFRKIIERKDMVLFRVTRDNFKDIYRKILQVKDSLSKRKLRDLDKKAQEIGLLENILIENASRGVLEVLLEKKHLPVNACIFAGRGNNGADGLALARHLANRGVNLDVFIVSEGEPYNSEVEFQLNILRSLLPDGKVRILKKEEDLILVKDSIKDKDLVIDAIFGIGFEPPLEDFHKRLFSIINKNAKKVLSVDIPSGLSADQGLIDEVAIKAASTVTFVAAKVGFFVGEGPKHTGKIFVKDIGISRELLESL